MAMSDVRASVRDVRWGLGDAAAGLGIANVAAVLIGAVILGLAGYAGDDPDTFPLALIAVLQVPLWAGYLGVPLYAANRKGNGVTRDFGLSMHARDVPVGIGAGLGTQFVAIPALYYAVLFPLLDLVGWDVDRDLSADARELTNKATDVAGVVLLVVIVVVLAPIIEELFFRGLLMRALDRRWGPRWALWIQALVFGAVHLQLLQLPALVLFGLVAGWLAQRRKRLGASIWAHVAFNAGATTLLLANTS
jgi:CAAX protease family protein